MSQPHAVAAVFMGSDRFSVPVLRALLSPELRSSAGVRVRAAVTQPDRPAGRGRKLTPNPLKAEALERGLEVLQFERLRDEGSVEAILAVEPDLIVVASYGQILPKPLLDIPRYRCLNLHPSLLPRYRGPAPVQGPILDGESETGTTLMLVRPKMDAGPILAQERIPIEPDETAGELEARLAELSGALLVRCLPAWLSGDLDPEEQDEREATYTSRISKADGEIDWSLAAEAIARRVRAVNPWPTAYTSWDGRLLRILRGHPEPGWAEPGRVCARGGRRLEVGTGDGLLVAEELQLAGGRPLTAGDLLRGHPELAGALLASHRRW